MMKKLGILIVFVLAGFAASTQTKPKTTVAKTAPKKECAMKAEKSCCKNEKAMSALRRPVAKSATAKVKK